MGLPWLLLRKWWRVVSNPTTMLLPAETESQKTPGSSAPGSNHSGFEIQPCTGPMSHQPSHLLSVLLAGEDRAKRSSRSRTRQEGEGPAETLLPSDCKPTFWGKTRAIAPQNLVAATCDCRRLCQQGVGTGVAPGSPRAQEVSGPPWFWGDISQPWGLLELPAPFRWTPQPARIYHR